MQQLTARLRAIYISVDPFNCPLSVVTVLPERLTRDEMKRLAAT